MILHYEKYLYIKVNVTIIYYFLEFSLTMCADLQLYALINNTVISYN